MMNGIERIREALRFIPVGGHDERVRAACMLKSELSEAGRDLWDEWRGDRGDDEADDVWRSVSESGALKIGSLFHQAKENGWRDEGGYQQPTPEELAERKRIQAERAAREEAEIARERANTEAKAVAIWSAAAEADAGNPYLVRKQVAPVATLREIDAGAVARILGYPPKSGGALLSGLLLVVPIKQGGKLSTVELIDQDGRKAALPGRGTKSGGYWATDRLPNGDGAGLAFLIGEGMATVLSASASTGYVGVAALSSGNLVAVARAMRERYPAAALVILADLVKATGEPDPHAIEAARSVGGRLAFPDFGDDRDPDMKDMNDLFILGGEEVVARAIAGAAEPARGEHQPGDKSPPAGDSDDWLEPQPLNEKVEPEPYPLDALPDTIRAAVEEVGGFIQAPTALVASSALAALSLACQSHIDVARSNRLQGPTGLFLLTIAGSGERKSTCDSFFTSAIRKHQEEQAEAMKPALREYQANISAWEAERDGITGEIKRAAAKGKPTDKLKTDLAELQRDKPEPPRVPRMLLGDETPENLAWTLAKQWPSAGVLSSEAGAILGAHGMGKDSVMRNLALLNVLWDGGTHSIGRRTSESFMVRGARLTVGLQIQEATLLSFFDKSGKLARGTGFLARFLVAHPESTQGKRPFTEAPDSWPRLAAFHQRITSILNRPVPMDEDGALSPLLLTMTPEAKAAWIEYHDAIEGELASGGELYDVQDVASKSADNAARLAALFHEFEGVGGAIGLDSIERASRIAAWHLYEARRFFGELALPTEMADAARLDSWLIEYCQRERTHLVPTREAQRLGPIREKERLSTALLELEELDRVRVFKDGRRKTIKVNPALVGVNP